MNKLKVILTLLLLFILMLFPERIRAQTQVESGYVIKNFESTISLQKDTSLLITENIVVVFPDKRHGIYRVIPVTYSYRGRTINSKLAVISVKDENGKDYKFQREWLRQSVVLKIGNPDLYVQGEKIYTITYEVRDILQKYNDSYEIYWNVTGSEWDTQILQSKATVVSDFAEIVDAGCFTGAIRTQAGNCEAAKDQNKAIFNSTNPIDYGEDFTIVVSLNENNSLIFPNFFQRTINSLLANWGYIAALIPFSVLFYFWWKKGRDTRYLSDNIYYQPENNKTRDIYPFERKHLPLVYHPIDGLTPSEVGTLIDEKVDIHDVVAEILELARLGFLSLQKIEKNKLFASGAEYAFIKEAKINSDVEISKLQDYQKFLLEELFKPKLVTESGEDENELLKNVKKDLNIIKTKLANNEYVFLSKLKNEFYTSLPGIKEKLYKRMHEENFYYFNPQKTRELWIGVSIGLNILAGAAIFYFQSFTNNFGPFIVLFPLGVFTMLFAINMPKRTPKGYSYYRQIEGLRWYLQKGAWRHEIAEKNLFIEEILPLAVSLGVVKELARAMKGLGIKPPSYFSGSTISSFPSDFSSFRTSSASTFMSAPSGKGSGLSSWSGGSGFSGGGSSGGGFGGGGGGSW